MKRARRAASVVGFMFAAAALLAAGIPAHAADAHAPDWQIAATVHYGPGGNASGHSAIVALRKDDAWAFGGTNPGGAPPPPADPWNGARWQASSLRPGLTGCRVPAGAP